MDQTLLTAQGVKSLWKLLTAGRIRLVNGTVDSHFKLMIDNHNLTVMAICYVPLTLFSTHVLSIGTRQRYEIVVDATDSSGN